MNRLTNIIYRQAEAIERDISSLTFWQNSSSKSQGRRAIGSLLKLSADHKGGYTSLMSNGFLSSQEFLSYLRSMQVTLDINLEIMPWAEKSHELEVIDREPLGKEQLLEIRTLIYKRCDFELYREVLDTILSMNIPKAKAGGAELPFTGREGEQLYYEIRTKVNELKKSIS